MKRLFLLIAVMAASLTLTTCPMSPQDEAEYRALEYAVENFNAQTPQENLHEMPGFFRNNLSLLRSFAIRMHRLEIAYPHDPRIQALTGTRITIMQLIARQQA